MELEIKMPMIGEDISEARVSRILVKEGEYLSQDQIFMDVVTDKVDIDLPSPLSGIIKHINVTEGELIAAGTTLVRIDTEDNPSAATRKLKIADLLTAIEYITARDSDFLCCRKELDNLRFEEFKDFVEDAAFTASRLEGWPISSLDIDLQEELRAALFFVTDLVKRLQGFNPQKLERRKIQEHKKIIDILARDSGYALQRFKDVVVRAGGDLGANSRFDPTRAYVFISYSHDDAKFARRFAARLEKARIAYFMDVKMSFGEQIPARVNKEVARASHMIVLISPGSARSAWVPYEIGYGKAREITIIPYLLHPSMNAPLFIMNEKYMNEEDEARVIQELAAFRRKTKPAHKDFNLEPWRSPLAKERIGTAKDICHQSVSSYASIQDASHELEEFVHRGGKLRCILAEPEGMALRQGIIRNIGESQRLAYLKSQFEATRDTLIRIAKRANHGGSVSLKTIDFLPDPILTLFDPQQEDGSIFVTLNGFGQTPASRPSFLLRKKRDFAWFDFYRDSFEKLWGHPSTQEIDLGDVE